MKIRRLHPLTVSIAASLAVVSAALLAGCGDRGAETPARQATDARTPIDDTRGGPTTPSFSASMFSNLLSASGDPPRVSPGIGLRDFAIVGEIELPGDRVERSYRPEFLNLGPARPGFEARLVSAGPSVEIVASTVLMDDLAPAAIASPRGLIVLRHPAGVPVDPAALRWEIRDDDRAALTQGTLLGGAPESEAIAAVRRFAAAPTRAEGRGQLEIDARLAPRTSVGQVNEALYLADTRIVEMRPGSPIVRLRMRGTADAASVQRRLGQLQASAVFEALQALPPAYGSGAAAPIEHPPPDPEPDFNDHRDV